MGREEISTLKTVGSILIKMMFQKRWSFHKIKIKKEKKEKKEKRKKKKEKERKIVIVAQADAITSVISIFNIT